MPADLFSSLLRDTHPRWPGCSAVRSRGVALFRRKHRLNPCSINKDEVPPLSCTSKSYRIPRATSHLVPMLLNDINESLQNQRSCASKILCTMAYTTSAEMSNWTPGRLRLTLVLFQICTRNSRAKIANRLVPATGCQVRLSARNKWPRSP